MARAIAQLVITFKSMTCAIPTRNDDRVLLPSPFAVPQPRLGQIATLCSSGVDHLSTLMSSPSVTRSSFRRCPAFAMFRGRITNPQYSVAIPVGLFEFVLTEPMRSTSGLSREHLATRPPIIHPAAIVDSVCNSRSSVLPGRIHPRF